MTKIKYLIFLLSFLINSVFAAQQDPFFIIKDVTDKVQLAMKRDRDKINQNSFYSEKIIEQIVLPHVDFVEMAKWIAGKSAWFSASPKDQGDFIKQFRRLLVSTYAVTLSKYSNEKIEFLPYRKPASEITRVQISSKIIRVGKEDINVDYRLIATDNTWKLYDLVVEGVSMLKGFQAQFSDQIRNKGLRFVIQTIKLHNEEFKK